MIAPLFLLAFGLGLAGMILLVRGMRGAPSLSEPRCAKCGYDLRGFAGAPPQVCSECGADLTKPHAVRWGHYPRQPKLIYTGVALLVVPTVVLGALALTLGPGPRGRPVTNAALIARLPQTVNQPWDWQELERRYSSGRLSNPEAAQAVDHLIASLAARPPTPGGAPLTWSEQFLTRLDAAGAIPGEQHTRLAKAFYGTQPTVRTAARVRQGKWLRFSLDYGGAWDLPGGLDLVKALRAVKLPDGRELSIVAESDQEALRNGAKPDLDQLGYAGAFTIEGRVHIDLPPGEHTLTFVLDAAALPPRSAPRVVMDRPGQAGRWPRARANWTADAPVKVTVVPQDQSPVEVVNNPALDPTGGIKIRAARVTRQGKGKRLTVEIESGRPKVGLSFDVVLRVAGRDYDGGWYIVAPARPTSLEVNEDLKDLASDVARIDVLLRPNPQRAELVPGAERVWGGAVELKDVPLTRYDVEPADAGPK